VNIAFAYDHLNALCFGNQLRPVTLRLTPWIVNEYDERLAGAWVEADWAIAIDRALLDHPQLLFGVLLHEMVHQAVHQAGNPAGHGPFFCAAAARAVAPLGLPAPTPTTASTWPVPVARELLGEM